MWAKEVQTQLREAIHLRNEKPTDVIPKEIGSQGLIAYSDRTLILCEKRSTNSNGE